MSIETLANVRRAAADWIDANQIGRRNLTHDQIAIIIGRRYLRAKKRHGGDRKSGAVVSSAQNEHLKKTAEQIAQEHHVGQATVRRAAAFVRAVEQLKDVDPTLERKVTEATAGTVLKSDSGPMEPRQNAFQKQKGEGSPS